MRRFLPLAAALVVATTSMLAGLVALALSNAQPDDRPGPEILVTSTTRKVERDLHPDEDPLPFPAPMIGSPPGLQADSLRLTPAVRGRTITLTARARVYDPVPGNLIAWRLQLHAGQGRNKDLRLLQDLDYADHAVTLPEGETVIMPTFQDSLELAPGRYTVTLWLYIVPPGFPRGLSTDELDRRALATLSTRHQVVVVEE